MDSDLSCGFASVVSTHSSPFMATLNTTIVGSELSD
jgi:hypothetical protein